MSTVFYNSTKGRGGIFSAVVSIAALSMMLFGVISAGCVIYAPSAGRDAAPAPDRSDEWAMFHHDALHTGFSTSQSPSTNNLLWKSALPSGISSSPVVSGGMLYVGTDSGGLYCLNESTGQQMWSFPTASGVTGVPAIEGGFAYFASSDGTVYSVDLATHKEAWNYTTGGIVRSSPAVSGGKVFIGSYDGKLYALDASAGTLAWAYPTGGLIYSSPAVSAGKVFIGSVDTVLYAINADTGLQAWNSTIGTPINGSATIDGSKLYVGCDEGIMYVLDTSSGALLWSNSTQDRTKSTPAIAYGKAYIGSNYGGIYSFDTATGQLVWSSMLGGAVTSSPAVAENRVFIGSEDGKIYAFDAATGAPVWNATTGGETSSPAIADGKLFAASLDGNVYCYGAGQPTLLPVVTAPSGMTGGTQDKVSVQVVSSSSLLPVENVAITFSSDNGGSFTPSNAGVTDSAGKFETGYVAPTGPVTVTITADVSMAGYNNGYASASIVVVSPPSLVVNVTADPMVMAFTMTGTLHWHTAAWPSLGSGLKEFSQWRWMINTSSPLTGRSITILKWVKNCRRQATRSPFRPTRRYC